MSEISNVVYRVVVDERSVNVGVMFQGTVPMHLPILSHKQAAVP